MDLLWRKSSRSEGGTSGQCVEVAKLKESQIAVRDSMDATGPILSFGHHELSDLFRRVKAGDHDLT